MASKSAMYLPLMDSTTSVVRKHRFGAKLGLTLVLVSMFGWVALGGDGAHQHHDMHHHDDKHPHDKHHHHEFLVSAEDHSSDGAQVHFKQPWSDHGHHPGASATTEELSAETMTEGNHHWWHFWHALGDSADTSSDDSSNDHWHGVHGSGGDHTMHEKETPSWWSRWGCHHHSSDDSNDSEDDGPSWWSRHWSSHDSQDESEDGPGWWSRHWSSHDSQDDSEDGPGWWSRHWSSHDSEDSHDASDSTAQVAVESMERVENE